MKPSAKRRVEQAVRTIMQADGDHCSLCRAPLQHNTRTFGGVTKDGTPRLVGECCKVKMHEIILMGVFVTRDAGDQPWGKPTGKSHPPADVEGAVTAMQGFFSQRDEEIGALSKRGGIKGAPAGIYREETFWKEDDAAWFEKHPQRSHRLCAARFATTGSIA